MVYIVMDKRIIMPVAVIDDKNDRMYCEKGYEIIKANLSDALRKRSGEQDFLEEWEQENL